MNRFAAVLVLVALVACSRKQSSLGDRVKVISTGQAITAQDYAVPGSVVVLEFTADW